jgi:3D (Asp-Asp-Asp) domain-containing protein
LEGKQRVLLLFIVPILLFFPSLGLVNNNNTYKKVNIYIDGNRIVSLTNAKTVGEALQKLGIFISPEDDIFPDDSSALKNDTTVLIQRKSDPFYIAKAATLKKTYSQIKYADEFSVLKYKTLVKSDNLLTRGRQRIASSGEDGKVYYKYKLTIFNGREIKRELITQKVVSWPKNRVIVNGTGGQLLASRAAPRSRYVPPKGGRNVSVVATGYYRYVTGTGRTATGRKAAYGVVAVDPRFIKLGTVLYIPGYGRAVAADTGGAIKGARIDLCFNTTSEAIRWGRRRVSIQILN